MFKFITTLIALITAINSYSVIRMQNTSSINMLTAARFRQSQN